MIQLSNFSYAYSHPHKVLDNINLTIPAGSFTVLLGPSGAGKTTLCLAVTGAVPHYFGGSLAGEAIVDGIAVRTGSMQQLAEKVGIVLQDYENQLINMTVEEEIAFTLENTGTTAAQIAAAIRGCLADVGLTGFEKTEVATLSGGQRQRLAIASVLAAAPQILVLDEPSSALDPEGAQSLYRLLHKLNKERGLTLLVVEHDIAHILPYADQLILLDKGKVLQSGSPETVLTYMWHQQVLPEGVPPLWQLKLTLEDRTGCHFAAWRDEQEAADQLYTYLIPEVPHA